MAASILRSALSLPLPSAEDSPTPPSKRFAASSTSSPQIITRCASASGKGAGAVDASGAERFRLYDAALRVYSSVRNGRAARGVHFPDAATKRKVYRLVFDSLYHREVIEELLIESGFFSRNVDLHGQESLVLLMTFDYQDRKFSLKVPRSGSENAPSLVLKVAEALFRHRVRLNATLARMRVKSNAQTTSQLMSEASYLKYWSVITEPFYVRVNNNRIRSFEADILSPLCSEGGFTLCSSREELRKGEKLFYRLHRSLLAFSPDTKETVLQHQLLTDGYLVQQDSASYLFVEGLRDLLSQTSGDVIVTHCNAGVEVAHIASVLGGSAKVIVYGALPMQMDSLMKDLHTQDIDNVEFVHAPFSHADASSEDLTDVSTIICLPPSSLSTVIQPLDFIHQEGDQFVPLLMSDKTGPSRSLTREQGNTLAQALTFSQCQNMVYAVRSQEENETSDRVAEALEQHRAALLTEKEKGSRDFLIKPVSAVEGDFDITGAGYNVTLLERKPKDSEPSAAEVIAKAITSGVLSGEGLGIGSHQQQVTHTKKRKKGPRIFTQHKGIPMTISAQNKVTPKKLSAQDFNSRKPFR